MVLEQFDEDLLAILIVFGDRQLELGLVGDRLAEEAHMCPSGRGPLNDAAVEDLGEAGVVGLLLEVFPHLRALEVQNLEKGRIRCPGVRMSACEQFDAGVSGGAIAKPGFYGRSVRLLDLVRTPGDRGDIIRLPVVGGVVVASKVRYRSEPTCVVSEGNCERALGWLGWVSGWTWMPRHAIIRHR
jgi:hypothetical protein